MNFSVQEMSPEKVVQANLDFYNSRDIEGFMSLFSDDIAVYTFPNNEANLVGLGEVRKLYDEMFSRSPNLNSTILKRIVFDNKVIDHESIIGRNGSDDIFEIVMIYEVENGKICRLTAIKK